MKEPEPARQTPAPSSRASRYSGRIGRFLNRSHQVLEHIYAPPVMVLLIAVPELAFGAIPIGQLVTLLTLPLWLHDLLKVRLAVMLAFALTMLAGSGLVMLAVNPTGRQTNLDIALSTIGLLVTAGLPIGPFLWTYRAFGVTTLTIAFGAGLLINPLLTGVVLDENTWKYTLSFPVCLILLALASRVPQVWPTLLAIAGITMASVAGNYRSLMLFSAVSIAMWGLANLLRKHPISMRKHDVRPIVFIASIAIASVLCAIAFVQLLLAGLLGSRAQESSKAQLSRAGDLLTGGRYEWIPTLSLLQAHPWGYGPGAIPNASDVALVHRSLIERGVEPSWQHVNSYMLGSESPYNALLAPTRFKLHSGYGDLWINFGPIATLFFIAILAVIVFQFIRRACTSRYYSLLPWFLTCWVIWDLAFSPIYTNLHLMIFILTFLAALTNVGSFTTRLRGSIA